MHTEPASTCGNAHQERNTSQERPEWLTRLSVISVTLMAVLGVSSIIPVLPLLGRVFEVTNAEVGLIVAVFTIPGVFFTLISGILSDRLGRKAVLLPALIIFSLSGAACAFATSFKMLLFFRFLQGIGAAPLGMLYVTIIGDLYEGPERLKMLGYNTVALGISTGCYPFLGGLLGYLDWRLTFSLPLLGLVSACLVWKLPLTKKQEGGNLGAYLKGAAIALRNKNLLLIFTICTGLFLILYGPVVTGLPLFSDLRFSANPMHIGFIMAVSAVGTSLAAVIMNRYASKHGAKTIIMFSQICYMLAMFVIPLLTEFWWLMLPMCVYGVGQGLSLPCITQRLLDCTPTNQRAVITSVNGTILRLAQSVGPLLAGVIQHTFGIEAVFYSGLLLALLLFIVTGLFLPRESNS